MAKNVCWSINFSIDHDTKFNRIPLKYVVTQLDSQALVLLRYATHEQNAQEQVPFQRKQLFFTNQQLCKEFHASLLNKIH
jgi:hypothetical protein